MTFLFWLEHLLTILKIMINSEKPLRRFLLIMTQRAFILSYFLEMSQDNIFVFFNLIISRVQGWCCEDDQNLEKFKIILVSLQRIEESHDLWNLERTLEVDGALVCILLSKLVSWSVSSWKLSHNSSQLINILRVTILILIPIWIPIRIPIRIPIQIVIRIQIQIPLWIPNLSIHS